MDYRIVYQIIFVLFANICFGQEVFDKDFEKRDHFIALGETSQEAGDHKKAIEYFNKALKYDSTSIEATFYIAVSYFRLDEHQEVIKIASKVLDTTSDYAGFYDLRGRCYTSIGEWEKGFKDMDKRISLGFKDGGTFYARGFCLFNLGFYDQAIFDFERAIEFDYKICESKEFIINAYLLQDKHLKAEVKIKEFLSIINTHNCDLPYKTLHKLQLWLRVTLNGRKMRQADFGLALHRPHLVS